ncbi:FMN-binding glutamate synthase family protein [Sporomusa sp.]|uniref:FMN-binding glutamate synthase family protein n=1 Tax=Sporomusa sp. TaxID=2078658 RepID=UPI002CC38911|nr:FMN-binding glutamate synthase family protein [Sporomusa sp.]HWR05387.1 FMN-binding glutamate synthase family protein [Sporomusa sp.]
MHIIITNYQWLLVPVSILALVFLAAIFLAKPITRYIVKRVTNDTISKLLTETYDQNLAELLPSLTRFSTLNLIELSLRAEAGAVIGRPLGSPKHFPDYDNLMFSPRQMTMFSLPQSTQIDMRVTLGSKAKKPLCIKIPLMIGGMAYGLGLSEEAKIALARASKALQTATNSGEGPFLPEEPGESGRYVLQICRWSWGDRTDKQIAAADMLEVQMGQGADMGTSRIEAADFAGRAQVLAGVAPGEAAISRPAPPGVQSPKDWPGFMNQLRNRAKGIPIALKIMATDRLEQELAVAVELGFDAVVIDGAGGGAHATAPIMQDDFAIPSLYSLVRAKRYLKDTQISLIVSGHYFTPGQCLKALALGADAIYLGTIPLFALTHKQVTKVTPWEPPTTLVYYNSPTKTQLNVDQAATNVTNVLASMILEMEAAMRALGKSSLKELGPDDLVAMDTLTADVTGVKQVSLAPRPNYQNGRQSIISDEQCQDSLEHLNNTLRYSHGLTKLMEDTLAEISPCQDLSRVRQLKADYNALVKQKSDLDAPT